MCLEDWGKRFVKSSAGIVRLLFLLLVFYLFVVRTAPAVETALETTPETTDVTEDQPPGAYDSLDSLFSLYQPYLENIGAYKPIYFLVGADPAKSKFQISLKYQLFNKDSTLSVNQPWLTGIHLAYTQTSIWDLKSDSAPFEDTSYEPEVFFLSKNIDSRPQWLKGLFFQTGLQHESNGRGGELSRSTNYFYFRPIAILYDETTQLGLQVSSKVWAYFKNEDENNPDLDDYRGYFELELKAGKAENLVFGSRIRWAKEGPSVQLDLTYPLDLLFFRNLDIYFQLQYVNALAETLLDYHKRTDAFRIGFAIVR